MVMTTICAGATSRSTVDENNRGMTRAPRAPDMRTSMAKVLNTLHGTRLRREDLRGQKISEETAFFTAAFNRLARVSRGTGRSFLKSVGKEWKNLKEEGRGHALFRAVDAQMAKLVEAGRVTAERADRVLRYAAGKGNLRGSVENLTSRRVTVAESSRNSGTHVERLLQMMRSNRIASSEELGSLRKHVYGTQPSKARESGSAPDATGVPPATHSSKLPSAKLIATGPDEMAWYPESVETGNAVFMVPSEFSDKIDSVTLYDNMNRTIAELDGGWMGQDGRRHFRADRKGNALGSDIQVVMHFTDGTFQLELIPDGAGFRRWGFTF